MALQAWSIYYTVPYTMPITVQSTHAECLWMTYFTIARSRSLNEISYTTIQRRLGGHSIFFPALRELHEYCLELSGRDVNVYIPDTTHNLYTYSKPEQRVQTNEPIVILTYVGPRWPQSKHALLPPRDTISRSVFRCLSSCFLRTTAILVADALLVLRLLLLWQRLADVGDASLTLLLRLLLLWLSSSLR